MSEHPEKLEDRLDTFRESLSVGSDAAPSVRVATEYIHGHLFDSELSVESMREDLGLTGSMFSARFRLHHGHTPACYIRHVRMAAVKWILRRDQDLRIADVAFYVGFEHYRTFARVFKRVTGHSPQAFRDQVERSGEIVE